MGSSWEVLPLAPWSLGDAPLIKIEGTFLQQLHHDIPSPFFLLHKLFWSGDQTLAALSPLSSTMIHVLTKAKKICPQPQLFAPLSVASSYSLIQPQETSCLKAQTLLKGNSLGQSQRFYSEPQNIWMGLSRPVDEWDFNPLCKKSSCVFLCLSWLTVLIPLLQTLPPAHCFKSFPCIIGVGNQNLENCKGLSAHITLKKYPI